MRPLPARPAVQERAIEFERALTAAALGGAGWEATLGEVWRATGRHCRLVGRDGAVLASTDGGAGLARGYPPGSLDGRAVTARDGWRAHAVAAASGGRSTGLLLIAEPVTQDAVELLRAAVTGVLIESLRRDANASFANGAAVIAGLRRGVGDSSQMLAAAAAQFGLRFDRPGCGAVLAHIGTQHRGWASALSWLD